MSEGMSMGGLRKTNGGVSHVCHLLNINPSQWTLLDAMMENTDNAMSCRELQDELGLDSSYVSRTLTRLMNKGLVSRQYVFVPNAPPRYCYTSLSKSEIEHMLKDKISSMKQELESVGLCVLYDSP
mgnify:FL=1